MYLKFKIFLLTLFLLAANSVFSADRYKWDKDNLILKAEEVKFKNTNELFDAASKIGEVDHPEAQVLARYYNALSSLFAYNTLQSKQELIDVYEELKEFDLIDQMMEIDLFLIIIYNQEDSDLVKIRYDNLLTYIYKDKYSFEKEVFFDYLINYRKGDISGYEQLIEKSKNRKWDPYISILTHLYYINLTIEKTPDHAKVVEFGNYIINQNLKHGYRLQAMRIHVDEGIYFKRMKDYDTSIAVFEKGIALAEENNFKFNVDFLYRGIAFSLEQIGRRDEALEYMRKGLEINKQEGSNGKFNLFSSYYAIMLYFANPEKHYKEALGIINELIQKPGIDSGGYLEIYNRKHWILDDLKNRPFNYDKSVLITGDINEEIKVVKDKIETFSNVLSYYSRRSFFVDADISNKLADLEERNKLINKNLRFQRILIGASLLLSLLLFGVIYNFWERNKLLKVVEENNIIITEQKKELEALNQKLKLALFKLKSKNTNLEEDLKKQILYTNNIKNMLNVLEEEINNMSIQDGERKRIHKIILESIDNEILDQIDFKFLSLNDKLFSKLSTLHPNMTRSELNLCGLIKMNLSNKEIALAQYKEVSSIKMAKWRLKRKIEEDGVEIESLLTYLNTINHEIDLMEESELFNVDNG